ncbi:MAG TPA: hypothetical protein VNO25_16310 [Streptosporangiaceae bacterium]|nr:hypothetical protein [Streptosporangiaceae bacterium]
MDDQGGRRSRPAAPAAPAGPADDARQAPWPPAEDPRSAPPAADPRSAAGQLIGPGTGGYRVLEAGSAPAPPRLLGPGSGPQPTLDRTPVRGFPPPASGYQQPPTPPQGLPALDGDDPVPPASITPASGGRRAARAAGPPGPRRRSSRVAWLAVAVALVVVAGAFAGYKFLYEPRVNAPVSGSLRLPTNGPSSPGFDQALGKWQHIGSRSQDPSPLTLAELFPPQFELDGSSYVRTAAAVSKDCTQAVFGASLQAALQAGHCTQVLRASYISGNGTMMGTVGVANLIGSNAAQKAGETTGTKEIIAPLAAQKGPTSKLGNGTGVVQAEIKGHYLILMWAEFTSLKSPSTSAQRQQLEQFAASLVTGSANINLSTRMLTGKA